MSIQISSSSQNTLPLPTFGLQLVPPPPTGPGSFTTPTKPPVGDGKDIG